MMPFELATLRRVLGVSRAELSRFLGVSEMQLARWESRDILSEPRGIQAVLLQAIWNAAERYSAEEIAHVVRESK